MAKNKKDADYGPGFLYARNLLWDKRYHAIHVKPVKIYRSGSQKSADGRIIDKPVMEFSDDADTHEVARGKKFSLNAINSVMVQQVTSNDPRSMPAEAEAGIIGASLRLEVRNCQTYGEADVGIRIMLPNIKKRYAERIGTPAIWSPPEGFSQPAKQTTVKPPEQTQYEKLAEKFTAVTDWSDIEKKLAFVADQHAKQFLTSEEFVNLVCIAIEAVKGDAGHLATVNKFGLGLVENLETEAIGQRICEAAATVAVTVEGE
jgi:hypothetical protein